MHKRCSSDFYKRCKKVRSSVVSGSGCQPLSDDDVALQQTSPTDTESALLYLKRTFPIERFNDKLPAVLLIHQVYSIIKCKTTVDKEIRDLQLRGTICLFKLGGEEKARVCIYSSDLKEHILKNCPSKQVIKSFVDQILLDVQDVAVDKDMLREKYALSESCISELMNAGLLALRSTSSFWFSFPNAGEFIKTYLQGRKFILRTIRKSKFSEILQLELEQRKLEKSAKLGIQYHIHDIIGAELVQCIDTTSGTLLRLKKTVRKK